MIKDEAGHDAVPVALAMAVVVMLKEQIKRFEGQPEMTGHA